MLLDSLSLIEDSYNRQLNISAEQIDKLMLSINSLENQDRHFLALLSLDEVLTNSDSPAPLEQQERDALQKAVRDALLRFNACSILAPSDDAHFDACLTRLQNLLLRTNSLSDLAFKVLTATAATFEKVPPQLSENMRSRLSFNFIGFMANFWVERHPPFQESLITICLNLSKTFDVKPEVIGALKKLPALEAEARSNPGKPISNNDPAKVLISLLSQVPSFQATYHCLFELLAKDISIDNKVLAIVAENIRNTLSWAWRKDPRYLHLLRDLMEYHQESFLGFLSSDYYSKKYSKATDGGIFRSSFSSAYCLIPLLAHRMPINQGMLSKEVIDNIISLINILANHDTVFLTLLSLDEVLTSDNGPTAFEKQHREALQKAVRDALLRFNACSILAPSDDAHFDACLTRLQNLLLRTNPLSYLAFNVLTTTATAFAKAPPQLSKNMSNTLSSEFLGFMGNFWVARYTQFQESLITICLNLSKTFDIKPEAIGALKNLPALEAEALSNPGQPINNNLVNVFRSLLSQLPFFRATYHCLFELQAKNISIDENVLAIVAQNIRYTLLGAWRNNVIYLRFLRDLMEYNQKSFPDFLATDYFYKAFSEATGGSRFPSSHATAHCLLPLLAYRIPIRKDLLSKEVIDKIISFTDKLVNNDLIFLALLSLDAVLTNSDSPAPLEQQHREALRKAVRDALLRFGACSILAPSDDAHFDACLTRLQNLLLRTNPLSDLAFKVLTTTAATFAKVPHQLTRTMRSRLSWEFLDFIEDFWVLGDIQSNEGLITIWLDLTASNKPDEKVFAAAVKKLPWLEAEALKNPGKPISKEFKDTLEYVLKRLPFFRCTYRSLFELQAKGISIHEDILDILIGNINDTSTWDGVKDLPLARLIRYVLDLSGESRVAILNTPRFLGGFFTGRKWDVKWSDSYLSKNLEEWKDVIENIFSFHQQSAKNLLQENDPQPSVSNYIKAASLLNDDDPSIAFQARKLIVKFKDRLCTHPSLLYFLVPERHPNPKPHFLGNLGLVFSSSFNQKMDKVDRLERGATLIGMYLCKITEPTQIEILAKGLFEHPDCISALVAHLSHNTYSPNTEHDSGWKPTKESIQIIKDYAKREPEQFEAILLDLEESGYYVKPYYTYTIPSRYDAPETPLDWIRNLNYPTLIPAEPTFKWSETTWENCIVPELHKILKGESQSDLAQLVKARHSELKYDQSDFAGISESFKVCIELSIHIDGDKITPPSIYQYGTHYPQKISFIIAQKVDGDSNISVPQKIKISYSNPITISLIKNLINPFEFNTYLKSKWTELIQEKKGLENIAPDLFELIAGRLEANILVYNDYLLDSVYGEQYIRTISLNFGRGEDPAISMLQDTSSSFEVYGRQKRATLEEVVYNLNQLIPYHIKLNRFSMELVVNKLRSTGFSEKIRNLQKKLCYVISSLKRFEEVLSKLSETQIEFTLNLIYPDIINGEYLTQILQQLNSDRQEFIIKKIAKKLDNIIEGPRQFLEVLSILKNQHLFLNNTRTHWGFLVGPKSRDTERKIAYLAKAVKNKDEFNLILNITKPQFHRDFKNHFTIEYFLNGLHDFIVQYPELTESQKNAGLTRMNYFNQSADNRRSAIAALDFLARRTPPLLANSHPDWDKWKSEAEAHCKFLSISIQNKDEYRFVLFTLRSAHRLNNDTTRMFKLILFYLFYHLQLEKIFDLIQPELEYLNYILESVDEVTKELMIDGINPNNIYNLNILLSFASSLGEIDVSEKRKIISRLINRSRDLLASPEDMRFLLEQGRNESIVFLEIFKIINLNQVIDERNLMLILTSKLLSAELRENIKHDPDAYAKFHKSAFELLSNGALLENMLNDDGIYQQVGNSGISNALNTILHLNLLGESTPEKLQHHIKEGKRVIPVEFLSKLGNEDGIIPEEYLGIADAIQDKLLNDSAGKGSTEPTATEATSFQTIRPASPMTMITNLWPMVNISMDKDPTTITPLGSDKKQEQLLAETPLSGNRRTRESTEAEIEERPTKYARKDEPSRQSGAEVSKKETPPTTHALLAQARATGNPSVQQSTGDNFGAATSTPFYMNISTDLKNRGFILRHAPGDGNCFFHAISIAMKEQLNMIVSHEQLRQNGVNYLKTNSEAKQDFAISEDYLKKMERDREFAEGAIIDAVPLFHNINLTILDYNDVTQKFASISISTKAPAENTIWIVRKGLHYDALIRQQQGMANDAPRVSQPNSSSRNISSLPAANHYTISSTSTGVVFSFTDIGKANDMLSNLQDALPQSNLTIKYENSSANPFTIDLAQEQYESACATIPSLPSIPNPGGSNPLRASSPLPTALGKRPAPTTEEQSSKAKKLKS